MAWGGRREGLAWCAEKKTQWWSEEDKLKRFRKVGRSDLERWVEWSVATEAMAHEHEVYAASMRLQGHNPNFIGPDRHFVRW
ncbi:uncharacterized protein G2W53_025017 [Senna tora]|uniref:Uncharacterized protein n=1 Tax=Senna tora TaxID=362788 RepID=A0A834WED3_9FABA|nr:uncharacterized protein G2W53_025017 [Senna tora]